MSIVGSVIKCLNDVGHTYQTVANLLVFWGFQSDNSQIARGVLQDSLHGSLVFLLFINDLNKYFSMNFVHYADDITVYMVEDSFDSPINVILIFS